MNMADNSNENDKCTKMSTDDKSLMVKSDSPVQWLPKVMSSPFVPANNYNKDPMNLSLPNNFKWSKNKFNLAPASTTGFCGKVTKDGRLEKFFDRQQLGTPSFPSPLDRIRCNDSKRERALQLGLTPVGRKEPYEANQSLPPITSANDVTDGSVETASVKKQSQLIDGSLYSFSYSAVRCRGSFAPDTSSSQPGSSNYDVLSNSWVYYNFNGFNNHSIVQNTSAAFPFSVQNPNKALLTIDTNTKEILLVNKLTCQLFGCTAGELISRTLGEIFQYEHQSQSLGDIEVDEGTGEMINISGKVVDIQSVDGGAVMPVSLWIKKLPSPDNFPRSLVVMEPVERTTANIVFDEKGIILSCDSELSTINGYSTTSELLGSNVKLLIPSLIIPIVKPGDNISKKIRKQRVTGRTKDGTTYPLSILLSLSAVNDCGIDDSTVEGETSIDGNIYHGLVWVFTNLSGIVTILPDGTMNSCNSYFSSLLFGYTQNELVNQSICKLIPSFFDDVEFLDTDSMALPPLGDDDDNDEDEDDVSIPGLCCDSRNSDNSPVSPCRPENPMLKSKENLSVDEAIDNLDKLSIDDLDKDVASERQSENNNVGSGKEDQKLDSATIDERGQSDSDERSRNKNFDPSGTDEYVKTTSNEDPDGGETPDVIPAMDNRNIRYFNNNSETDGTQTKKSRSKMAFDDCSDRSMGDGVDPSTNSLRYPNIPEGSFFGNGVHKDGADLALIYQIRRLLLDDGQIFYCLWISRDPEDPGHRARTYYSLTLASSVNSSVLDVSTSSFHSLNNDQPLISSVHTSLDQLDGSCLSRSCSEAHDSVYTSGRYGRYYTTLKQIGKGAFGCVKLSYRNADNLLVITKFIKKSKILKNGWIRDGRGKKHVALEVALLTSVNHPNIVKVLDVYENDDYCQMVMEKHGSGMDLFEFIDRGPRLDEPLTSYIFRQVISAVSYLHSVNIIHRDIKDENIIIDQRFHVKLIDFGSAAFMDPNRLFNTFCGTMEYCSPEVLLGNRYLGPELEIWALGITLYTLVFGENPFYDSDEIINAKLKPPFKVSEDLMEVIKMMLAPNPNGRCNMLELKRNSWFHQAIDVDAYRLDSVIHASAEELNPVKYIPSDVGGGVVNK